MARIERMADGRLIGDPAVASLPPGVRSCLARDVVGVWWSSWSAWWSWSWWSWSAWRSSWTSVAAVDRGRRRRWPVVVACRGGGRTRPTSTSMVGSPVGRRASGPSCPRPPARRARRRRPRRPTPMSAVTRRTRGPGPVPRTRPAESVVSLVRLWLCHVSPFVAGPSGPAVGRPDCPMRSDPADDPIGQGRTARASLQSHLWAHL